MKHTISEKEWQSEFQEFLGAGSCENVGEPAKLLLEKVTAELNPPVWRVFLKLALLHGVVGTFSLLLCNQFGMNPFGTDFSLSDYFMQFGHSTCMLLCGTLFAGLSISAAGWWLRPEEQRVLGRNFLLELFLLGMLSLGVFAAFGAYIALTIGGLWLAGSLAGGLLARRVFWRRPPARLAAI
jgi:hypothetical protein